ncbi:MAG: BREX-1 system phosphatase PglZ type B [Firmicutes bacterium]|nr:BREX-1 system phosphatase PglZ type B [Bacillota bacterium]
MNRAGTKATVFEELLRALDQRASAYNPQIEIAPAVILWTDKERQWEPLVPRLREALPHFLTLGPYSPQNKTGPAIWIRCMIARMLPEADWSPNKVPILYLPGVSRHELRAIEECPRELQPLAELQYRGIWFTQENTKDWTVYAFFTSKRGGLGLDIAGDDETREALLNALGKLADIPVAELCGRRLYAADFHTLLQPDLIRELLRWLDDPVSTQKTWTTEEWQAFCAACRDRYGFDPEKDREVVGAEKLGAREGSWETVWERFAEAPGAYPSLPGLLRKVKPQHENQSLFYRECWPQCNEEDEDELRHELMALAKLSPEAARSEIEKLEAAHGARRTWVWAKLGEAPLAQALQHLARLAEATKKPPGSEDVVAMAEFFVAEGWHADAAVLDALAEVTKAQDVAAVTTAIQSVYNSWLEAGAERFQKYVYENPKKAFAAPSKNLAKIDEGTCVLFADGLRLDLGKRLRTFLEKEGFQVEESWRWVPWPPVTSTAKPGVTPVADLITGEGASGEDFQPVLRGTAQILTPDRFRQLLNDRGFQVLSPDETGDPEGRGWTEFGVIDRRGHKEGWKLAHRVGEEIAGLMDRIRSLFEAGWKEIRVVTDHGWLLVPGGLPKVKMPYYLVESRWTRCGTLKPGSKVDLPTVPWYWNPDVIVVLAPGIDSFQANTEYSHGGLSLQECVVLDLVVRPGASRDTQPVIDSVRWTGLRCRIHVTGAGIGWYVDLRTKVGDPASSLLPEAKPQPIEKEGHAALVVDEPDYEGMAAVVVLLDAAGRVVAKQNTIVGGEG